MKKIENVNWKRAMEAMAEIFDDSVKAFNNFAKAIVEINRILEQEEMTKKCLIRALYQKYTGGINRIFLA